MIYDVTVRDDGDCDTEGVFRGSQHDCSVYMDGYIQALRTHSNFVLDSKSISATFAKMTSPCVSEGTLYIEIIQVPEEWR